ncbi:hypothetical protein G7A66_07180 [Altererythrobacter sp. SALINAS58]|uniref:hypothetical protein n=1 Tax=Alteripontixanthobacter muriae TaxID=2705546 RepID=UPI0015750F83|nr:hypothetical protein [Alteripontixanthobacter muriae]
MLDDADNGSVTRFGIVPYSHTVNVGRSLRNRDIQVNQDYADREVASYGRNCYYTYGTKMIHVSQSSWNNGKGGGTEGNRQSFRTSGDACIEERPSIGNGFDPVRIEDTISRSDIDDMARNGNDDARQFGRYDPACRKRRANPAAHPNQPSSSPMAVRTLFKRPSTTQPPGSLAAPIMMSACSGVRDSFRVPVSSKARIRNRRSAGQSAHRLHDGRYAGHR